MTEDHMEDEETDAPQEITCSGGVRLDFGAGNRPAVQEEEDHAGDDDD
jgi:hypothetical protein